MRSKGLRGALSGSLILSALDRFAQAVYNAAQRSFIGGFLTGYEGDKPSRSFFALAGDKIGLQRNISIPLKRAIGNACEHSFVIRTITKFIRLCLNISMQVYGIGLFSAGMYTSIVYLVTRFAFGNTDADLLHLLIGVACAIVSVPLMFSNQPLGEAITQSRLGSLIFMTLLGFRRESICDGSPAAGKNTVAFVAGMVIGLSTYFISPLLMLVGIVGLTGAYMLLSKPEIGVLLLIGALPFLPTMYIAALTVVTAGCFFLKYIRGKRVLRVELLDVTVAIFMLITMCGGVFSINRALSLKPALLYVCFIAGYFLVVNLIRTPEWARRCTVMMMISAFAVAAIGIYENFFGQLSLTWIDAEMFEGIEGRVVSTFANPNVLAEYLIMTLPFALTALLTAKKPSSRLAALIATGASALCLVYTWSRGAWLGIIMALLFYFLIYSRKTLSVLCFGLLGIPFLPLVLPSTVITRFTSIGNLADTSTAYRVHIWMGSLNMARDVMFSGLGSGMGVFAAVYPQYALGGIEAAPHSHNLYLQMAIELGIFGLLAFVIAMICFARQTLSCRIDDPTRDRTSFLYSASGLCGVLAFLAQGMTDYVWYNFRIYAMFWLVVGLTSAIARQVSDEKFCAPCALSDY